jgi:hypothetical protein
LTILKNTLDVYDHCATMSKHPAMLMGGIAGQDPRLCLDVVVLVIAYVIIVLLAQPNKAKVRRAYNSIL